MVLNVKKKLWYVRNEAYSMSRIECCRPAFSSSFARVKFRKVREEVRAH